MNSAHAFSCCILTFAVCSMSSQAQDTAEARAKLEKLLQERVDTLEKAVKVAVAQYQGGALTFGNVTKLEREWLKARLALSHRPEERLVILRDAYELSRKALGVTEARFQAGQSTQLDVLEARAAMLEAQIELLKEEQKQTFRK